MTKRSFTMPWIAAALVGCAHPAAHAEHSAPAAPAPTRTAACDTPAHHQLDFWIGDWNVAVRARVAPDKDEWTEQAGTNHIHPILGGCALEENFAAAGGAPGAWAGRSLSVFVPQQQRWRQTWVDDSGAYLAFTGGPQGADFVLTGETTPQGKTMRMVFTVVDPDHLHWRWEGSTDGEQWNPMMTIEYTRMPPRR